MDSAVAGSFEIGSARISFTHSSIIGFAIRYSLIVNLITIAIDINALSSMSCRHEISRPNAWSSRLACW
jgi:hypothetical protein